MNSTSTPELHIKPTMSRREFATRLALGAASVAVPAMATSNRADATKQSPMLSGCSPDGRPLPKTRVIVETQDRLLQDVIDEADKKAKSNISVFTPELTVLVEGGGYTNVWLETQPMGGAMYAKRNLTLGLNNQLIFMNMQRADGRFPGMIRSLNHQSLQPDFDMFQGYYFPQPAWDIYFLIKRDQVYLARLYSAMKAFDSYLWKTRNSCGRDCLESWCVWDTGEDNSTRYKSQRLGNAPDAWPGDTPPLHSCTPFESMDVMGYSCDGRSTLARISRELGNGLESYWYAQAEQVRRRVANYLWVPEKHACYDRDKFGHKMNVLIHNNLQAMWFNAFTQRMADEFLRYHLFNPAEFWTPAPLPSIAVNDPKFRNAPGNNWSGQPEGLTYQRAIRALENYGHFAEVGLVGSKLLYWVGRNGKFTQQIDPFTGKANGADGYGPCILSVLEYVAHMHGVQLVLDENRVWWSGLSRGTNSTNYIQQWGSQTYQMENRNGKFSGRVNDRTTFSCSAGVRVITDLHGVPQAVVGIDRVKRDVTLQFGTRTDNLKIEPNQIFNYSNDGRWVLARSAPFDYPFRPA